ncbi:hypothetical protein KR222_003506 [Zaprionus bogoriensis]|nr:hypothetical protein KR222_003506 [Zaprionus bogoriensis]
MKFLLLLACLALYVASSQAQRCRGNPSRKTCEGPRDEGHRSGRSCHRHSNGEMWYYDERSRSCQPMVYYGCGGNNNRYCTLQDCQARCLLRN